MLRRRQRRLFVGTFTAVDLQVDVIDGQLVIRSDTGPKKFIPQVEHRTFSGSYAVKRGQPVLYVTERCVFQLTADGLELTEVAPGVDIERDILARMDFAPIIRGTPIWKFPLSILGTCRYDQKKTCCCM